MPTKPKQQDGPGAPSKMVDPATTTLRIERVALEKVQQIALNRSRKAKVRISAADVLREAVDEFLRRHPVTLPSD